MSQIETPCGKDARAVDLAANMAVAMAAALAARAVGHRVGGRRARLISIVA
jgi:hypothetical protein